MSNLTARLAQITREHDAARVTAGVTGPARRTAIKSGPSRATADIITSREAARDAMRRTERQRHAEGVRLGRRLAAVHAAADECRDENPERAARLDLLAGDVESARDRYVHATWQTPAESSDWEKGGRFWAYSRRFDLGFISMDRDDIMQEGAELLAIAWRELNPDAPAWRGELTATGARTMPHTIGDGYRAIRHAYRRGLGFYGYERRGKVVERDASTHGYHVGVSFTSQTEAWRAEDEAAIRARVFVASLDVDDMLTEDEAAALPIVQRRRAALDTLTRRFPLNADGRMLALATLITEGYTLTEISEGLGVGGATLTRWADELATVTR